MCPFRGFPARSTFGSIDPAGNHRIGARKSGLIVSMLINLEAEAESVSWTIGQA